MRRLLLLSSALVLTLPAQVSRPVASINPIPVQSMRIARGTFTGLERRFDGMLFRIGNLVEPIDPLGATRGVYLEGFGAVLTAELGLVLAPDISPFRPTITPEMIEQVHRSKLQRLPVLIASMREMMRTIAMTLIQVPEDQQIVLVVRLDYLSWENTAKLPNQIMMRADRKSALAGEFKEESQ
jgi:hypothetical protein